MFKEASKVLLHPRCANCHPSGDSPKQGDDGHIHNPPVARGENDKGTLVMECKSCHQEQNVVGSRVPGAPKWHVAPIAMAWEDKSPGTICEQLKDIKRNGGRSLDAIVDHVTNDKLVGWGWAPGADRKPAPGSQKEFGSLMAAWVESGAACP